MKSLALLRHAKSSWDDPALDDFDRPLNARGRDAATAVGRAIQRLGLGFDLVVASPARRARETLDLVMGSSAMAPPVTFDPHLYMAGPRTLLGIVHQLADSADSALLVGHNPGFHDFVLQMTTDDEQGLRHRIAAKFPTAALAVVSMAEDQWGDAGPGAGSITRLILARELE